MEANLFIKSYKAEGKKIKDIQFYGDWEISMGSGELEPNYIETRPLEANLLPYGMTFEKTSEQVSGGTKYTFKLRNNAPWPYYISANRTNYKFTLPAGKVLNLTQTIMSGSRADVFSARIFSEDKIHCVGVYTLQNEI